MRRPAAAVIGVWARAIQRASSKLAREAVTDSFMVLALPGRVLALGTHLADAYPDVLRRADRPGAERSCLHGSSRFRQRSITAARATGRTSTQRMHYIVHLFRVFHLSEQLTDAPFTAEQIASFTRGVIPDGEL